jgi:hypothetical protein
MVGWLSTTKTEESSLETLNLFLHTLLEVWIEASRQQVSFSATMVRCLGIFNRKGWCALRPEWHGNATDDVEAAERCGLGTVCRGRQLDAKRDTQQFEAYGPSTSSNGVIYW